MPEKEPVYFKEFRETVYKWFGGVEMRFDNVDKKFKESDEKFISMDEKFKSMDKRFESLETSLYDLTLMTAKGFLEVDFRFDNIENQMIRMSDSMQKIEGHIGRYEVRSTNIERILLEDFKPRIKALEEAVLAQ